MANKWAARVAATQKAVYAKHGITVDMRDLAEAKKTFDAMGKVPAKVVTAAARAGATVTKRAVKGSGEMPVLTGTMRHAIRRLKPERSKLKGKKVYPVGFDPRLNDVLQKPIQNPGEAGGENAHAYYPSSMEYGFLTRSKGGGISYFPGFHFMAHAGEGTREAAKAAMAKKFNEAIQKEWTKRHGT